MAALGGGLVASLVACNLTPPPQQEAPPTQPSSATASSSQSQGDLDDQFMYHRAIEAVIWSMPAPSEIEIVPNK